MGIRWPRGKREPSWQPARRLPVWLGRAAAIVLVVLTSFASVVLYKSVGQRAPEPAEVIQRSAAPEAPLRATVAAVVPMSDDSSPRTLIASPPAKPAVTDLLRPGAELMSRIDVSLDGSAAGQIALTSRYTATAGCEALFADLFSLVDGRWVRVFEASSEGMQYGAVLPPAAPAATGCFPKLRLFSAEPAGPSGRALLLLSATYADSSLRLVVLGWDPGANGPALRLDWRTGANGTLFHNGSQVQIGEDVGLPPGVAASAVRGPIGRLTQVVALDDGAVVVSGRRLSPTCDRGRVGAGTSRPSSSAADESPERLLVLQCSAGVTAAAVGAAAILAPAGIAWSDIRDGDSVQVEFDSTSLEPDSLETALPRVATLTDNPAAARHQGGERPARQPAAPNRSGAAPAQATRAPAPAVRPAEAAPRQPRDQTAPSDVADSPPAVPTRPPARRSLGPPAPPVLGVTAPPPPRTPPFVGPPPRAPR